MARLTWGDISDRWYETGIDQVTLYSGEDVYPWDGVISLEETPEDVEFSPRYQDGTIYFQDHLPESFAAALTTYTYPTVLTAENWVNMVFRTRLGSGEHYQLHILYNVRLTMGERTYSSLVQDPEAVNFVWNLVTIPDPIPNASPSAHLIVDSRFAYFETLDELESALFGTEQSDPRFLSLGEVLDIFENYAIVKVTDNGDGSFIVEGPDSAVYMTGSDEFEVDWPSAVWLSEDTYRLSSL